MIQRPDQPTSHTARVSGVSLRERLLIVAAVTAVGAGIFLVAMSRQERPVSRNEPTTSVAAIPSVTPSASVVAPSARPVVPVDPYAAGLWAVTAADVYGRDGSIFAFNCPSLGEFAPIWGTGDYTVDSSVCTAAAHLAFIGLERGGIVQIALAPGQPSYHGNELNDVISQPSGPRERSFEIAGLADPQDVASWRATAESDRAAIGSILTYDCPPGVMVQQPIWGTSTYTDDSAICTAAVHSGRITREDGGRVRIEIRPGQDAYQPAELNGIRSEPYGHWDGSYVFVDR
jgi:hypothetical protein